MAMLTLNGAALPDPSALSVELQDALLSARRTLSGAASEVMSRSTVDFPQPLGPTKAAFSPGSRCRLIPFNAGTSAPGYV